jgi:serine O-acetyltransferase
VDVTAYQREFLPYGTPCSDCYDPDRHKLEQLQAEVQQLQKRLTDLIDQQDAKAVSPDDDDIPLFQERGRA